MSLKVKSIQLITNNPKKIENLTCPGMAVSGHIPHIMEPDKFNRFYFESKAENSGNLIDFFGKISLPLQADPAIVRDISPNLVTFVGVHNKYYLVLNM